MSRQIYNELAIRFMFLLLSRLEALHASIIMFGLYLLKHICYIKQLIAWQLNARISISISISYWVATG